MVLDSSIASWADHLRKFHELDYSGPVIYISYNILVSVNSIFDIRPSVHPEILRILYCR